MRVLLPSLGIRSQMLDPEDEDTAIPQNDGNYAPIDKYRNTWFFTNTSVCALIFTARTNVTSSVPQCIGRRSDVALNSVPFERHLSPFCEPEIISYKKRTLKLIFFQQATIDVLWLDHFQETVAIQHRFSSSKCTLLCMYSPFRLQRTLHLTYQLFRDCVNKVVIL